MNKVLLALALLLVSTVASAESFVIKDIRVEGLQRISAGTVFNYLPVKVGDKMTAKDAQDIIRALFKSKYFSDVQVDEKNDVLIIKVKERPAIASIEFVGNKDIKTKDLLKSLRQIGFAEGQVFEKAMLERVELELERQYYSRGKYGVTVNSQVTPLPRNRVAITITMSEGAVATIGGINIVGNKAFSEKELLDQFQSTTGDWLSSFTHDNQYSRQKLSADLETLKSFYLDRGYVDFTIESTQVSITDDKKKIFITINISEGQKYKISQVRLAGKLIVPAKELFKLITIKKNAIFSRKAITKSTKNITDRLGDDGYAFANVNAVPQIDHKKKEVKLTFFVDPGRRAYVRRINITGNSKTRDEVIRRELRQQESAWISTKKVNESRARISRLGYFEDVNVNTKPVPGTSDQVDLDFDVTEQPSGSLSAGFGFSQTGGLIFNANVTQKNFLGSGKYVSFGFNNSSINTEYSFGYTNPYATIDGISQGFNAYYRKTNAYQANLANYSTNVLGGNLTYGIPISENNRINLGVGAEDISLHLPSSSVTYIPRYRDFLNAEGSHFTTLSMTLGWSSDTRDSATMPTKGMYQSISGQVALPVSSLEYYKIRYSNKWYHPLTDDLTFSLRGDFGYADAFGKTQQFPFFENFYAGGIRSVRGYRANTLGYRENGQPLGGNMLVTGSAEVIFPVPFLKKTLKSFRLSAFVDAGNVYDIKQHFDPSLLRYSTGISAIWVSPFGPMAISFAKPYNQQPGDQTEVFQFALGTAF